MSHRHPPHRRPGASEESAAPASAAAHDAGTEPERAAGAASLEEADGGELEAREGEGGESLALDEPLAAQLPVFEQFFKTFGFKRVHGRIWGLLVLHGHSLSAREISSALSLSQGATSTALNELIDWGAITSEFDSPRRCHLHSPVSNTLSIVATVMRRREQVAFQQFHAAAARTLAYVQERYGERDPRVLTLRSIISTCEIAEAVVQLVVTSVANALDDSESLLHKALSSALRVGLVLPGRVLLGTGNGRVRRAERRARREQVAAGKGGEARDSGGQGG